MLNINKAHFPVTVLGPGRRIGIWVQGCKIGCKNCVSVDTWDSKVNRKLSVANLLAWCEQVVGQTGFDGITISGGEPFDQPVGLTAFLEGLHQWRNSRQLDFDILCYSGYPFSTLKKKHQAILNKLDALIPEPFIDSQPTTNVWRGSANQTLQLLSRRAEIKYASSATHYENKQIQVMVDETQVWTIGIPARGDMLALEATCREQGIVFHKPSWRA